MKKITHIPAFTLIDVIITLAISMLVVGIAFSVFHFTYQQIYLYKEASQEYKDMYQLYAIIQDDFQHASTIESISQDNVDMKMDNGKEYKYTITDEMFIRQTTLSRDTFYFDIQQMKSYFKGEEQSYGRVDELKFSLKKGDMELPFRFNKEYSAEMNMELEEKK